MLGMIFLPTLALCLFLNPISPVDSVWKTAVREGFSGGAIVVSGKKTLLLEVNNTSQGRSFQIQKNGAFPICSVTKAMTAEVVLALTKDGKLGLDQKIGTALPWLPSFAQSITIRQLLNHTSGLRNMDLALGNSASGVGNIYFSVDPNLKPLQPRILKIIGENPVAVPGEKYDYNNADFLVLQAVIESVTKQPFERVLRDKILGPAKMKHTGLSSWAPGTNQMLGCYAVQDGKEVAQAPFNMGIYGGAAGVVSTPQDLCQWLKFTLTSPSGQTLLNSGSQFGGFQGFGGYAYRSKAISKRLGSDREESVFERPGAVNAYSLQVSFLPERQIAVAVFANRDGVQLGSVFEGKGLAVDLLVAACSSAPSSQSK